MVCFQRNADSRRWICSSCTAAALLRLLLSSKVACCLAFPGAFARFWGSFASRLPCSSVRVGKQLALAPWHSQTKLKNVRSRKPWAQLLLNRLACSSSSFVGNCKCLVHASARLTQTCRLFDVESFYGESKTYYKTVHFSERNPTGATKKNVFCVTWGILAPLPTGSFCRKTSTVGVNIFIFLPPLSPDRHVQ